MADRFGSDQVERALAMQEGSVLANEVLRLRGDLRFVLDDNERMLQQHTDDVAALERVLGLHRRVVDDSWPMPGHCAECYEVSVDGEMDYEPYPCPTVRALEGS